MASHMIRVVQTRTRDNEEEEDEKKPPNTIIIIAHMNITTRARARDPEMCGRLRGPQPKQQAHGSNGLCAMAMNS